MIETIAGGLIAGFVGVGISLWLEHRREEAQRLMIVNALLNETIENQAICDATVGPKQWMMTPFKLDAYRAYKGRFFFLPQDVSTRLIVVALIMEHHNNLQRSTAPIPPPPELIRDLECIDNELRRWDGEHTGCRLCHLASSACRRLRNLVSETRVNSH